MALIGVTGGAGAGKTTVLRVFAELGAPVLDADDIVHQLYAPGTPVHSTVRQRWGDDVVAPDGCIDRRQVAALVFASAEELAWLSELIHPLVRQRFLHEGARASAKLFCAVPLLFEAGWQGDMASTIAVWCDPATQHRRLQSRGWTDAQIEARLGCQLPDDEKLLQADFGIVNNGGRALLREQCGRILDRLRKIL